MGDSDRVPPTARADALTTRPAFSELEPLERTEPLAFPLLTETETFERETERILVSAPRTGDERATLTFLTGVSAGQVVSLPATGGLMGRASDALVSLDDQGVSRRHARILPTEGGFFIEDLESTNGTFVAGVRVGSRELRSGDRIQLGPSVVLRYALIDSAEEALQRRLYESSTRDALTGAYNRAFLAERLVAEIAHARRHKAELALLMLDLDGFKAVNDKHGHLAGDAVLRAVSSRFARLVRVEDIVARYGGEEFVMLLRATPLDGATRLAERLREAVAAERVETSGATLSVTVSIGVATLAEIAPEHGAVELLALADGRLYQAKVSGRNRVCATGEVAPPSRRGA